MIIKFDFGTQNNVPLELVSNMLCDIQENANDLGVKTGGMSIYLQLYDEDGLQADIVGSDKNGFNGKSVNFIVRNKPYVRKSKDKILFSTYCDKVTGEQIAYIYKHYSG